MQSSRTPVGSGTLYPSLPARLRADITRYFDAAPTSPRRCMGILVPHGPLASTGSVIGAAVAASEIPRVCVILGPNHGMRTRAPNDGSILTSSAYRTPLGDVPPDEQLSSALLAASGGLLADDPVAHDEETAVEVILPFLQVRRPDVRIVPILLAWHDWERGKKLADALYECVRGRDDVLIIASSELGFAQTEPLAADQAALLLDRVITSDAEGLLRASRDHHIEICGLIPLACALAAARSAGRTVGEVVGYSHSGVPHGDRERVTSYASALIGIS